MVELGYKLCSEEHGPGELVEFARRPEEVGFGFAMVSDHFHPWTDRQGQKRNRPGIMAATVAVACATIAG